MSGTVTYWCDKCKAQWTYTLPKVSCCVAHSDGHCHYGEKRADGFD